MFNEIRITRFYASMLGAVLVGLMLCSQPHAKSDPDKDEVARQEQRLKNMSLFAEKYTIFSAEDRKKQFKFHENALFRFNNPVTGSGTKDGTLYMWSERGRPQAILKFYTFNNESYAQIFLSLSERTLVAEREGNVKWNPTEPPRSVAKRVVSTIPLAIVHGRNDHLIPFHFSLGVSSSEIPDAHAVVVPGMGHAFDPVGYQAICDALDWTLDNATPRPAAVE